MSDSPGQCRAKKYTIFRMPDEDDENYDQHELIGVEYGSDIFATPISGPT